MLRPGIPTNRKTLDELRVIVGADRANRNFSLNREIPFHRALLDSAQCQQDYSVQVQTLIIYMEGLALDLTTGP